MCVDNFEADGITTVITYYVVTIYKFGVYQLIVQYIMKAQQI